MAQYIDKNTLVAEIKNLENRYKKCPTRNSYEEGLKEGRFIGYKDALYKINTIEAKEVDLDKALSDLDKDIKEFVITEEFKRESETCGHYWTIAKHAFLFGLNKAQEGIN